MIEFLKALKATEIYLKPELSRLWRERRDPYNKKWEGNTNLRDTGRMFRTSTFKFTNTGNLNAGVENYGLYHQFGTKYLPVRQWIGLPDSVADRVVDNFIKELNENNR